MRAFETVVDEFLCSLCVCDASVELRDHQRPPRGPQQPRPPDQPPQLRLSRSRATDRADLPLLRRHHHRPPAPMTATQTLEAPAFSRATASRRNSIGYGAGMRHHPLAEPQRAQRTAVHETGGTPPAECAVASIRHPHGTDPDGDRSERFITGCTTPRATRFHAALNCAANRCACSGPSAAASVNARATSCRYLVRSAALCSRAVRHAVVTDTDALARALIAMVASFVSGSLGVRWPTLVIHADGKSAHPRSRVCGARAGSDARAGFAGR
jgi:hypothetical protein